MKYIRFTPAAITAALILAGCGHGQSTGAGSTTPAAQQQAIQQNLATRAAWIKAHPMPGMPNAPVN